MSEDALISIIVVSYNSSKTVLETLDSIRSQTYGNIELIICDDASTDDTVELETDWIKNNGSRFSRVQLVAAEQNGGVTINCNRGCRIASGTYIKLIAADDVLLPEYASNIMECFSSDADISVLFSDAVFFPSDELQKLPAWQRQTVPRDWFALDAQQQFEYMKNTMPMLPTPSVAYRTSLLRDFGWFDERIPMWEDGPLYYKLSQNHVRMFLLDKKLVSIRIRADSLSHSPSVAHIQSHGLFYKYYAQSDDFKRSKVKALYHTLLSFLQIHWNVAICRFLFSIIQKVRTVFPVDGGR